MTLGLILVAAALGAPMFAVFAALAWQVYAQDRLAPALILNELNRLATMPMLRAMPLFALGGYLLAESRAPERLLRVTRAAFGWLPGGLAMVAIAATTLFTAFTGASGVTIIALGGLLLPALQRGGYGEPFSLGAITTGGNLGVLIVPSLPLLLYGIIAGPVSPEVTIERLIRASLGPALLGLLLLFIYSALRARRQAVPRAQFDARELWAALWEARWELPLPILLLAGIYSGRLVLSDAAAVTAAYAWVVETLILREVRWNDLARIVREAMILVGGVLIILGMGMAITNWLVDQEIPQRLLTLVQARVHTRVGFLIILNLFLLAVGCAMDIYTAIVVLVPLLIPLGQAYEIHPVHLGVITLTNLAIGYSTPPVGMNLFIAALRFQQPLLRLARASLPWIFWLLILLGIVTYVPVLSLGAM